MANSAVPVPMCELGGMVGIGNAAWKILLQSPVGTCITGFAPETVKGEKPKPSKTGLSQAPQVAHPMSGPAPCPAMCCCYAGNCRYYVEDMIPTQTPEPGTWLPSLGNS